MNKDYVRKPKEEPVKPKPADLSGIQLVERQCKGCFNRFKTLESSPNKYCCKMCKELKVGWGQFSNNKQKKAAIETYEQD